MFASFALHHVGPSQSEGEFPFLPEAASRWMWHTGTVSLKIYRSDVSKPSACSPIWVRASARCVVCSDKWTENMQLVVASNIHSNIHE